MAVFDEHQQRYEPFALFPADRPLPPDQVNARAPIQRVDVHLPTTAGRLLIRPRYTEPEPAPRMILNKLNLALPAQPPSRIRRRQAKLPAL